MFNYNIVKGITVCLTATTLGTAAFAEFPQSFADLAEEVSPAVVRISTTTTIEGRSALDSLPNGQQIPEIFKDFFGQIPELQSEPRESQGLGSGFIIDDGKFVVTNNHVIKDANQIIVETIGGEIIEAELIGTDPDTDIAVLKITSVDMDLPSVEFGDSDGARVGDWVMAVGNPLGQNFSVTTGIVSARQRSLDGAYDDFIQTDAAINRGNSGGPLFNMEGEVIGVNTAILSPNGGSIGLGFSMASNTVETVVDQIIEFGEARRGWLGVSIGNLTQEQAEANGLKSQDGALIMDVSEDGPASDAGMKAGDVVVKFAGENVTDSSQLVKLVGKSPIDQTVKVDVYRPLDGKVITLEIKLGKRPNLDQVASNGAESPLQKSETVMGMALLPLDETTSEALGAPLESGLIINELEQDSAAAKRGIRAGDVILEVNQRPVKSVDDFTSNIEAAKDGGRNAVMLLVYRSNQALFIALPIE